MIVGILSDSHGKVKLVRQAVAIFDRCGAEHLIHCGDVGDSEVFEELLDRPLTFVWGNTDEPTPGLLAYLRTMEVEAPGRIPAEVTLDHKTFAVFHGHEPAFGRAVADLKVDYLLHGHTHVARDERRGATRIINPGALHRASRRTVAVLDTRADGLVFHEVAMP